MFELFEQIIEENKKANPEKAGDYHVNGLLYCGKCHYPRQQETELMGHKFLPYIPCLCMQEEEQKEKEREEEVKRMIEIQRNTGICFYDQNMREWTFANDNHQGDASIMNAFLRYAENFPEMQKRKKGLLIYGSQGVGKSYGAGCVANHLLLKGYRCIMTSFSRIINAVSGMREGKQEYIDDLCRYDLLIIDDLSAERETEYAEEIVMNVIETRCVSGLPIIVTTNLTPDELKHTESERKKRIYSRLFGMTFPINYVGEDRRKRTMVNDYAEIKAILGL